MGCNESTRGFVQVLPGPLLEVERNYMVGIALGNEHFTPGKHSRTGVEARLERQGSVENRAPFESAGVGQQQSADGCGPTAETDQGDRSVKGCQPVEPFPKPLDGRGERFGDRTSDTAVGEPGVTVALGDRRSDGQVGGAFGEPVGQPDDRLLVRTTAVQENDEWSVGIAGSSTDDDRRLVGRGGDGCPFGSRSATVDGEPSEESPEPDSNR